MSSAQRDLQHLDESAVETEAEAPFALREQVAERLAAHRARKGQHSGRPNTPAAEPSSSRPRSARIAAAVAERYAHSQSYRAFLAAEAERAIRQAEAAAEVAALNAQAVADAQYKLLDELDQWSLTSPAAPALVITPVEVQTAQTAPATPSVSATASAAAAALTVRLYEYEEASPRISEATSTSHNTRRDSLPNEEEGFALDEEIAFRQAPAFEPSVSPTEIPANLIEFPRQLVAPRKARPRLAEGPLREDADHAPETTQLRIFEVEATQISTAPAVESVEPEWSSILLSPQPAAAPAASTEPEFNPTLRPQTAPLNLRLMAALVDCCAVATGFLSFTGAFALTIGRQPANTEPPAVDPAASAVGRAIGHMSSHMAGPMSLQSAAITSVAVLAFLGLAYQLLFFTLSESTPGMRFARIAFCTFSDDNPTRSAMRRRIFAVLLSACPLGLGFLWAFLDEDGLGWHDRVSRMYQRSY